MATGPSEPGDQPGDGSPRRYSRAFEKLVTEGDNDIVGLLAYALLKQTIHEEAARGVVIGEALRDPSPVTVQLYRDSAEGKLNAFASRVIDEAREEIQESAILAAIQNAESNISEHVTARTGTLTAIVTNVIGWAVTVLLAIIIVAGLAVSGAYDAFLDRLSTTLSDAVRQAPEQ